MGNKKLQIWLPLIFSVILVAGMYFGFRLRENIPASKGFFKAGSKTSLQEVLDMVRLHYVDSVKTDSLQYGAINEMMSQLDPHSIYIPASSLEEVNEDITGTFDGIGIEFNIFSDTVNVVHVIAGGPGDKAGLQVGDKLIKVNNENITGPSVTSDDIKKRVKGERGTVANLTVIRNGETKQYPVRRGHILIPAIDAAYMLDKTTGYIRLNKFSESSYEEFMKSLEELKKNDLRQLVLDLRGNGGGLMDEAVQMADEFLSDDKLVVYTEGHNTKRRDYKCRRPGLFEEGKLAVLIDEFSASASEVLAGALQDWDRAVIIGRRSFGKGLVQQQYSLSDGSAVRLTIGRYYTPVGRSIQRSYENGREKYMGDIMERYHNGEMIKPDSSKILNGMVYQTKLKKRKVYGGGGITPDVFVAIDTGRIRITNTLSQLDSNSLLGNFMYSYYMEQRQEINKYKSPAEFSAGYNKPEDTWKSLLSFATGNAINLKNITASEKDFLITRIKAQLARYHWRTEGYYEIANRYDPLIQKAIDEVRK